MCKERWNLVHGISKKIMEKFDRPSSHPRKYQIDKHHLFKWNLSTYSFEDFEGIIGFF
jgi:hypothetical protein